MATTDINGTTLWYETEGSGLPCIVLHGGLGVDHWLYRSTLAPLAEAHTVLWYDQRGNGRSDRAKLADLTIEQLADDAAALLETVGDTPALVVGHSYGGFVAQELALRRPDAVRGLVLIATGPGQLGAREVESEDGIGPPMPPKLAEAFSTIPGDDEELRSTFEAILPYYVARFDADELLAGFRQTIVSRDAMVRGFEVLATWSSVDRLAQVTAPTLVVGGRLDPVMSWPQQVRIAKRIPRAQLALFDHSSHFVWLDEPDRFWTTLQVFLDGLPSPSSPS